MVACNICFDLQIKRFFHSSESVLCVIRLINHSLITLAFPYSATTKSTAAINCRRIFATQSSPYVVLGNTVRVCAQVQN